MTFLAIMAMIGILATAYVVGIPFCWALDWASRRVNQTFAWAVEKGNEWSAAYRD